MSVEPNADRRRDPPDRELPIVVPACDGPIVDAPVAGLSQFPAFACCPSPDREASPARSASAASRLDLEARRRIGRNLRLLYADILNQPLPERFEALLADLPGHGATRDAS